MKLTSALGTVIGVAVAIATGYVGALLLVKAVIESTRWVF